MIFLVGLLQILDDQKKRGFLQVKSGSRDAPGQSNVFQVSGTIPTAWLLSPRFHGSRFFRWTVVSSLSPRWVLAMRPC